MINNLEDYFEEEQDIFLDKVEYSRIEDKPQADTDEITLVCQDSINIAIEDNDVTIIIKRTVKFDPAMIFNIVVAFGANLKFNEKKNEIDWNEIDLTEEFRINGRFITTQLMSRISLLVSQITSSYGQQPLVLPPNLASKSSNK